MNNNRRSHNRIVLELYLKLKNLDYASDPYGDKLCNLLGRYGKKTREEALQMLKEDFQKLEEDL